MAGIFVQGETKVRPGVYTRYESGGIQTTGSLLSGIGACVFRSSFGPLNEIAELYSPGEAHDLFGDGGTTAVIDELFYGGASSVIAVRAGTGGTATAITLKDSLDAGVVTITAKYVGARAFAVTIRDSLVNTAMRELTIYEGTTRLESYEFTKTVTTENEVASLVAAMAASPRFTATKIGDGSKILGAVTQAAMVTGTDPTVETANYSTALAALELAKWNVLAIDTVDSAAQALIAPYLDRVYASGLMPIAVLKGNKATAMAERITAGAGFNNEKVVYVLNHATDTATGLALDDYRLAARIAGLIAGTSSNISLTHTTVPGLAAPIETLSNASIESAISNGCLVLTLNSKNQVWVEAGVNTLVTLAADQDEGWKKIRRTKARFELMQRIVTATESLIGYLSNDKNGRATFIANAQTVINDMTAEGKLADGGIIYEDPDKAATGDSAWFVIAVVDLDSIEKAYLTFRFKFSV